MTDFVEPAAEVRAETTTAARPADSSSPVIGIDLGTTNSCAAVVRDGKPEVIPLRGGHRTIPSVVAWSDDGKVFTGPPAKAQMELNPRNSVYGAKRLVGRPFWSPVVQQMKNFFRYELVESPNRQAAVKIRDRTVTLEEISSCILKEIREAASQTLRQDVTRAVISVPAYFNQNQRNGVREAGVLAGLQVECVVNEPTAAAIAYGYSRGLEQRVLVYDLGGGTFDVTVLELCGSIYQVLATGGDTFLGGVDFDTRLAESIFGEFCRGIGTKPRLDPVSATRLLQAAERAKCDLSEKEETGVTLPFFVNLEGTPLSLDTTVTRDRLEQVCRPLVEETLQVVHDVLARSRLRADQLDAILLVGGQSRMPLIWRRIREEFGIGPFKGTHPDEAVAQGAALLAGTVRKIDSVLLVDVVPLSIGIGLRGGKYQKVIQAQTALPASGSTTVRTWEYNQSVVQLDVYQGEEDDVALNEYLGSITMEGITLASTGDIQVKIDLVLDVNGQLRASWQELGIDQTHEVEIESKKPGITDRQET